MRRRCSYSSRDNDKDVMCSADPDNMNSYTRKTEVVYIEEAIRR